MGRTRGGLPETPVDIGITRLDLQAVAVQRAGEKGLRQRIAVVGPMDLRAKDSQSPS